MPGAGSRSPRFRRSSACWSPRTTPSLLRPGVRRRGARDAGREHRERSRRAARSTSWSISSSARKIKAVFVETSVSERNVQALVEGCAARGTQVEDRRRAVLRRRWASRHAGRNLRRHGPAQRRHDRAGTCDEPSRPNRRLPSFPKRPRHPRSRRRRPILDVHDVTVAYHRKPVLWDVDLTLDEPRCRHHRAQRRRQEHADQGDPRPWCRWPAAR